ncbi:MAG: hypothetical protein M3P49_06050 [Actinomycetota bacterium]|nr:hypothetical protein [Actinomycetota bacterium]
METHRPVVVHHGPAADHDMPCCVYGCENPAVLEFGAPGTFTPCWEHQREGYTLVTPHKKRGGFLRRVLG